MDLLTLVSLAALVFGGGNSLSSTGPVSVLVTAEWENARDSHPLFPLLETPATENESDRETSPDSETQTGNSELEFGEPTGLIFVPLDASDHPHNDTPRDPLFVPLSPGQQED